MDESLSPPDNSQIKAHNKISVFNGSGNKAIVGNSTEILNNRDFSISRMRTRRSQLIRKKTRSERIEANAMKTTTTTTSVKCTRSIMFSSLSLIIFWLSILSFIATNHLCVMAYYYSNHSQSSQARTITTSGGLSQAGQSFDPIKPQSINTNQQSQKISNIINNNNNNIDVDHDTPLLSSLSAINSNNELGGRTSFMHMAGSNISLAMNPVVKIPAPSSSSSSSSAAAVVASTNQQQQNQQQQPNYCPNGLLTFELSTGFIYKPASAETLAMVPSTLQLTDCLNSCLQNNSCLAINFEMGLCVLLSSSAQQNPTSLYSSQFPVFTIYAEKKCLLSSSSSSFTPGDIKNRINKRRQCQRAWTFERVAGYEMRTKPRRRLKLANKELCMEACLTASDFECRSANWYRQSGECTLSDQDRHSISQAEANDQRIKVQDLYGPSNLTLQHQQQQVKPSMIQQLGRPPTQSPPGGLYQNYYTAGGAANAAASVLSERSRQPSSSSSSSTVLQNIPAATTSTPVAGDKSTSKLSSSSGNKYKTVRSLYNDLEHHQSQYNLIFGSNESTATFSSLSALDSPPTSMNDLDSWPSSVAQAGAQPMQYVVDLPANALVDYLENNCIYEPNKLCEFRKIQNKILKTVDSIYQDINSLEECKQKCLNAPYRCYSFDYGDTSERVCRTSHLDQASLMSVKDPYLEVVGAITYELASCFNVSIQCRAREMVVQVSSSKMFKGKIYAKSRPISCQNDIKESLQFELSMRYHDENCDVRSGSNSDRGVFSNDIIIQHHDRIVTTQDVGLSVYCQYDLGNRSITNNVDLAIERIEEPLDTAASTQSMESKTPNSSSSSSSSSSSVSRPGNGNSLTITSLATTVVRSPNVTMRITNMNGQPVSSATVGDRLALLFEIKEKTSPFGIFVREIIAMDGKQMLKASSQANNNNNISGHDLVESLYQANKANSVMFIDSQGCPTDANIMGPLQKMDPTGQRILAPFDAFKFPASDMVFFRAVVSSCVSECRPVVCNQAQLASTGAGGATMTASDFDLSSTLNPYGINGQTNEIDAGTTSHLVATTRNMQPVSSIHQQQQAATSAMASFSPPSPSLSTTTTAATTTITTITSLTPELFTGSMANINNNKQQQQPMTTPASLASSTVSQQQSSSSSSVSSIDSITTIAGFGAGGNLDNSHQGQEEDTTNFVPTGINTTTTTTNNHQIGKLQLPRPPIQQLQLKQNSSIPSNGRPDFLASAPNLDLSLHLSSQLKQQLVKLFEQRLRSPSKDINENSSYSSSSSSANNHNLSEIADVYARYLTSIMLNGNGESSSSSLSDDNAVGSSQQVDDNNNNNLTTIAGALATNELLPQHKRANELINGAHHHQQQQQVESAPLGDKLETVLDFILASLNKQATDLPMLDRDSDHIDQYQQVKRAEQFNANANGDGATVAEDHQLPPADILNVLNDDKQAMMPKNIAPIDIPVANKVSNSGHQSDRVSVKEVANTTANKQLVASNGNQQQERKSNYSDNDLSTVSLVNSSGQPKRQQQQQQATVLAPQPPQQHFDRLTQVSQIAAATNGSDLSSMNNQRISDISSSSSMLARGSMASEISPSQQNSNSNNNTNSNHVSDSTAATISHQTTTTTTPKIEATQSHNNNNNNNNNKNNRKRFTSYGRRRRRSIRLDEQNDNEEEEKEGEEEEKAKNKSFLLYLNKEDNEKGDSNQVVRQLISQQAQNSLYLDPISGQELPFKEAIVEMYHHHRYDSNSDANSALLNDQDQDQANRVKRETANFEYDQQQQQQQVAVEPTQMEELVVQSIKIVDRLQFNDEDQSPGDDQQQQEQQTMLSSQASPQSSRKKQFKSIGNRSGRNQDHQLISSQQQLNSRRQQNELAAATSKSKDEEEPIDLDKTARWSALSLIMVGMLFIFAQTFLVLICLLDWTRPTSATTTINTGYGNRMIKRSAMAPPIVGGDYSTMSSRCGSTLSISTNNGGGAYFWPEDSARLGAAIPVVQPRTMSSSSMATNSEALIIPTNSSLYDHHDSRYSFHNSNRIHPITMPNKTNNNNSTNWTRNRSENEFTMTRSK